MKLLSKAVEFEIKGGCIDTAEAVKRLSESLTTGGIEKTEVDKLISNLRGKYKFDNMYVLIKGGVTKLTSLISKELKKINVNNDIIAKSLQTFSSFFATSGTCAIGFFDKVHIGSGKFEPSKTCLSKGGYHREQRKTILRTRRLFAVFCVTNGCSPTIMGRCLAYYLGNYKVFLCNFYEQSGYKNMIRRLIVEGLGKMANRNLTYKSIYAENLPFYYNRDGVIVNFKGETIEIDSINFRDYLFACSECGEHYKLSDMKSISDLVICNDCIANSRTCEFCGRPLPPDYDYELCEECYDNTFCCDWCGDRHYCDDGIYVDEYGYYCSYCYNENFVSCERCGEPLHIDDGYIEDECGNPYCDRCAERYLNCCEECGCYFRYDEYTLKDKNGNVILCEGCYEALKENNIRCCYCGCLIKQDVATEIERRGIEEFICQDCRAYLENYSGVSHTISYCIVCNKMLVDNKHTVCKECMHIYQCDNCGKIDYDIVEFDDETKLCEACCEDRLSLAYEVYNAKVGA